MKKILIKPATDTRYPLLEVLAYITAVGALIMQISSLISLAKQWRSDRKQKNNEPELLRLAKMAAAQIKRRMI